MHIKTGLKNTFWKSGINIPKIHSEKVGKYTKIMV
jgi:hypothetical protein